MRRLETALSCNDVRLRVTPNHARRVGHRPDADHRGMSAAPMGAGPAGLVGLREAGSASSISRPRPVLETPGRGLDPNLS